MAKVLYHITMSLDGFVTGPDHDMSWLSGLGAHPNAVVAEVLPRIGAVLIGHRTFRGTGGAVAAEEKEGEPYGGAISVPTFVFTRDDPATAARGRTFVSSISDAVAQAGAAAGDRYVAVLGATTARRCLEAGLLDEVLVHIAPLLLGDGVRLLARSDAGPVRLEWIARSDDGPITNMWARVVDREQRP